MLGRFLQLRSQGYGYGRAAREIGCGTATLFRLHQQFIAGGLLALEIPKPTGRPPSRKGRKADARQSAVRKVRQLCQELTRQAQRVAQASQAQSRAA